MVGTPEGLTNFELQQCAKTATTVEHLIPFIIYHGININMILLSLTKQTTEVKHREVIPLKVDKDEIKKAGLATGADNKD